MLIFDPFRTQIRHPRWPVRLGVERVSREPDCDGERRRERQTVGCDAQCESDRYLN